MQCRHPHLQIACWEIKLHENVVFTNITDYAEVENMWQSWQMCGDPASYQANHHIRNCCLICVLCDQRQCDVAGHTDEQANTRERSRGDVRAQRVVCEESTRGLHHHHQHQEASSKHHPVMYLTMSNTNTLTITCLCYPVR